MIHGMSRESVTGISQTTFESGSSPHCWVCGSSATAEWKARSLGRRINPDDLRITDSRYGVTLALRRCTECGFIQANETELPELTALYEQMSDPEYERGCASRTLQMRWLLTKGLKAYPSARTLLDVGAGTGLLVAEAKARGLDAVGIEPSHALANIGRQLTGVSILQGTVPHPSINGRRFDLVYLVDVIEHVSDPLKLLKDCAGQLTPGGTMVVVTPDVLSLAARILGKRWWHFRLAHVGYFSRHSMKIAARATGMEEIGFFRARWFFPISYLAERLSVYLPVGALNRAAPGFPPLKWLYRQVIPLNPHDSMVCLLQPRIRPV